MHDIEDLARVGREVTACPYFAARHFAGKLKQCTDALPQSAQHVTFTISLQTLQQPPLLLLLIADGVHTLPKV